MSEWISVEDRLPEAGVRVLLTDGIIYKVGQMSKNGEYWDIDEEPGTFLEPVTPIYFTHWLKIPQL